MDLGSLGVQRPQLVIDEFLKVSFQWGGSSIQSGSAHGLLTWRMFRFMACIFRCNVFVSFDRISACMQ
jgi:hypothetical protein